MVSRIYKVPPHPAVGGNHDIFQKKKNTTNLEPSAFGWAVVQFLGGGGLAPGHYRHWLITLMRTAILPGIHLNPSDFRS